MPTLKGFHTHGATGYTGNAAPAACQCGGQKSNQLPEEVLAMLMQLMEGAKTAKTKAKAKPGYDEKGLPMNANAMASRSVVLNESATRAADSAPLLPRRFIQ